jgi:hypothetical protein
MMALLRSSVAELQFQIKMGHQRGKKLKVRRYSAIMILPIIFQILLDLTPAVCRPKGKHWGS